MTRSARPLPPTQALPPAARRAIGLTLAGMWWERLARAFWMPVTLAMLALAALALGLVSALPQAALGWVALGWALAFCASLLAGWRRFRRPLRSEALARVDLRLAGRPLSALGDRMVLGGPGAEALWRAHMDGARRAAAAARPAASDAGLAVRDPFALRLIGLTALAMALLFGGAGPLGQGLGALAASWTPAPRAPDQPVATGPAWEGWAEPPRHTRRPTIYLNALKRDALTVPEGTVLSFRLYGQGLEVEQDVGAPVEAAPDAPRFAAARDGMVQVGGRSFAVTVVPDAAPTVQLAALAERRADGRMAQGFLAGDDHGVASGLATVELDLPAVDRRYGLAVPPEPREALVLDLPLPTAGQRRQVTGTLSADLARHPWANLPVRMMLTVRDGLGQPATTPATPMILPGRRFFDPLAAGLVELRRDLLWSRENAAGSARLLRSMVWRPDRAVPDDAAAAIVAAVQALESGPLGAETRDRIADSLWDAAVQIEDGGLGDALERMRQAQERLSEAIRNGASRDEIQKLMDELKAATDDYTRMLAERGEDPSARFDRSEQQGQAVTGDQIQEMMDEIQRLMNEGRMAEAQELLEQFNRMMENLEVREGGEGGGSGSRPMDRLSEALREQQRLADEAMREAQRDPFGQSQPGQPGEGQQGEGQQGQGQQGQGQQGEGAQGQGAQGGGQGGQGSLVDRQRALRDELGRQQGLLPGQGTPQGDAARQRLDDAGRAMADAEGALRDGDPAGAMDSQADAIEAMREGMRALGDLARSQQGQQGQGQDGQGNQPGQQGSARADGGEGTMTGPPGLDPLGRESRGQGGNVTTGEPLAEGEAQAGRARELQDEIRRRSGDLDRPRPERDYLGRLLDHF